LGNIKREKIGGSVIGAPATDSKLSDTGFYGGGIPGITAEEEAGIWAEAERIVKENEIRRKEGKIAHNDAGSDNLGENPSGEGSSKDTQPAPKNRVLRMNQGKKAPEQ
jgi:hypothetical protein